MPVELPWERAKPDVAPPTREQFRAGRRRRFGQTNPELVQDPFLDYMVKTGRHPFFLREEFGDMNVCHSKGSHDKFAIWSFGHRNGMTTTPYLNEFMISIGGEYDDWYDPDFLIYNDVVVRDLAGGIWIYNYPRHVFAPTDFHTATLLEGKLRACTSLPRLCGGDAILIIGGLGYPDAREWWRTPIYLLDLACMEIHPLEMKGPDPGWIYNHESTLLSEELSILVSGGSVLGEDGDFHSNADKFVLDLGKLTWIKH